MKKTLIFEDIRSQIENTVLTELESKTPCVNSEPIYGGKPGNKDKSLRWYGTKFKEVLTSSNAVFEASYNAGYHCRESLLKISWIAGGTQKDFQTELSESITKSPIGDASNPQVLAEQLVQAALENSLDKQAAGKVVGEIWHDNIKNGSYYRNYRTVSNSGNDDCVTRASQESTKEFNLCNEC